MTIHSHDGDRTEKPGNTGPSTHGRARAPRVTRARDQRGQPRADERISSGVSAAAPRQVTARAVTPARPSQPYSRLPPGPGAGSGAGPRTTRPSSRTNVTPANPAVSATAAPATASTSR